MENRQARKDQGLPAPALCEANPFKTKASAPMDKIIQFFYYFGLQKPQGDSNKFLASSRPSPSEQSAPLHWGLWLASSASRRTSASTARRASRFGHFFSNVLGVKIVSWSRKKNHTPTHSLKPPFNSSVCPVGTGLCMETSQTFIRGWCEEWARRG